MNERPSPLLCARCGAPLPPSAEGSIACPFCGVVNQTGPKSTELRAAVRDVLAEDRNRNGVPDYLDRPPALPVAPTAPAAPIPPGPFIWIGAAVGLCIVATIVGTLTLRPKVAPARKPATTATATATATPPPPAPPPPKTWGPVGEIAFDESGDVVATIGANIVKADASTLAPRWIAPLDVMFGGGNFHRMLVPRGERIALVNDNAIQFFESATGTRTGQYRYDRGGILKGACGAGKSQVIVSVLGGGAMRFDAVTGKKATGSVSCALRGTDLECGPNQWCGWRPAKGNNLDCRYELRAGKDVFRGCDTLDGTKRKVVVAVGAGGKPKWQTEASLNGFMGMVDGVLIVNERQRIRALDPATGTERWSRALGAESAVVTDARRVFYGVDGTIVATEAKTGAELARMAEQKR